MSRSVAAVALALTLCSAAVAHADDDWIEVPHRCHAFAAVPEGDARFWNARMSLAACMLDLELPNPITDVPSLDTAMHGLADKALPALFVYEDIVANAPEPVRYRAAYHIALVMTAMVTRVRAGLPRDCSAELRGELEDRLVESTHALRVVLESIEAVAESEPAAIADPVNRAIAKAVHAQVLTWR